MKKVLLINPAKDDAFVVNRLHMGLTLLGGILDARGHAVKIMDYAFLKSIKDKLEIPSIEQVIGEFQPDVIGMTVFSYVYDESLDLIERIAKCSEAPILLGGPHFIMFPADFQENAHVSYTVKGEAETVIVNLVENARKNTPPVRIVCTPPAPEEIPPANLELAFGSEYLEVYQIQLSRGCPFQCNFCNVRLVAGQKMRYRDISLCVEQIVEAKKKYPSIHSVVLTDDVPIIKKDRFKLFLKAFISANLGCELMIDNVRADLLDEETVKLYVEAGGRNICLGVESGHPEVFKMTHKGESLDKIAIAAKLVKENNLLLGLCFVIGLPGDTLHKHLSSINFAKILEPNYVFWNMCVPWPETEVREWFDKNGEVGELRNFSTIIDPHVNYNVPRASSHDFPTGDRIKAWFMANLETYQFSPKSIGKVIRESIKLGLYRSLAIYLLGKPMHVVSTRISVVVKALKRFRMKS